MAMRPGELLLCDTEFAEVPPMALLGHLALCLRKFYL